MPEEKSANIQEDIRELVAEIIEVEPEEINPESDFINDLDMDSMMALEILASIEKKYKIAIPEEELSKFKNLKVTVDIVSKVLDQS